MKNQFHVHNRTIVLALNNAVAAGLIDLTAPAMLDCGDRYRTMDFIIDGDIPARLWVRPFGLAGDTFLRAVLWPIKELDPMRKGQVDLREKGRASATAFIERKGAGYLYIPREARPEFRFEKLVEERLQRIDALCAADDPLNVRANRFDPVA